MVARRLLALGGVFVMPLAALSGCEPSLIGDYGSRNSATGAAVNSGNSSGANSMWTSPRWAAHHGQTAPPPQPPVQPAAPQNGTVAQGGAPWSNPTQNAPTPNASIQQADTTMATGTNATPPQPPVCEDSRPRALDMPGESCARPCRAAWRQCFDRCNDGQDRSCVATCDDTYRECMRGCY